MQPSFLGSYHTRFTMAHLQLNRTYICHSLIHVFICPCWRRVFIVALKRIIQILYEIKWDHLSGSIKSPKNYVKPIAGLNYSIRRIVRNLLDSNRCRREATRKKNLHLSKVVHINCGPDYVTTSQMHDLTVRSRYSLKAKASLLHCTNEAGFLWM